MFNILAILLTLAVPAHSHEGHGVPGSTQAKHGGVVKGTHQYYLELVQDGETLKIYPMTHDLEPLSAKDLRLEATTQLPRSKEKKPLALKAVTSPESDFHYEASFQAKGAHRFALEITAIHQGKREKILFQVEPR